MWKIPFFINDIIKPTIVWQMFNETYLPRTYLKFPIFYGAKSFSMNSRNLVLFFRCNQLKCLNKKNVEAFDLMLSTYSAVAKSLLRKVRTSSRHLLAEEELSMVHGTPHIFFRNTFFCLSRQKSENFCIFLVSYFVKPHKISAYSDNSYYPQKNVI